MVGKFFNKVSGFSSLILLQLLPVTAFKCDDEKPPLFEFMIFELPFGVTPEDDSIKVGDTLWIFSNFPDTIREYNSGNYFKLVNFNFNFSLALFKLTNDQKSISEQPGATSSFNFIQKIGFISFFGETFNTYNMVYSQEKYISRIGIIPQTSGVFCINFLGPAKLELKSVIDLGKTKDGRQRIPSYRNIYFTINEGLNNNFDLFKQNCRAVSIEFPIPDNIYNEQKGTFTFRVVE